MTSPLIYHNTLFPRADVCINADISQLHHNDQILYGDWLPLLNRGKTWYGLHYDWPSDRGNIPEGYDTYVISWHYENWDHNWIDNFCQSHPDQQLIVIGEFSETPRHPNLKILEYHCWHLAIPFILQTFGKDYEFKQDRNYRISSLCNKPSLFKTLISAYLLKTYHARSDLLLSWNPNGDLFKEKNFMCQSMNYIESLRSRPVFEPLVDFYLRKMTDLMMPIDQFKLESFSHVNFNHPAFYDSMCNLTNETYTHGQTKDRVYPGPYFSEKTWKPMLGGTGIIPVGHAGTYERLREFGFCIDYPWPCDFDQVPGDLDRIERVFDVIDWIMSDRILDHKKDIMMINEHNYTHIRSKKFVNDIVDKNQKSLEHFLENY